MATGEHLSMMHLPTCAQICSRGRVLDESTRTKINELRNEVDQEWAFSRRKEYLSDLMADLVVDWWFERARLSDYTARGQMMETILTQEEMAGIAKRIVKYQNELYYRRKVMAGNNVGVTPDEIGRARHFPWDELLEFDKRGFALCPFHGEKTGSFHINNKGNRGYCFGCKWSGDQIDFWMKKNGRSFADAVRSLQ
jgi:hypothetical protein